MSWQNYVIKKFMRVGVKPNLKTETLDSGREVMTAYVDRFMPQPPRELEVTRIECARFQGEWVKKKRGNNGRTILYLHGGGFMTASAETHRGVTCGLAMENAGAVWALDYPLAPEHSIEEIERACIDAYEYLLDCGIAPGSIAIAGDQAGAWLATKLLISLHNSGKPLPAAVIMLCPFLDPTLSGSSYTANKEVDPISEHHAMDTMIDMVFGGKDLASAEWCLLHADLSFFPPALIHASNIDLVADDANRITERLEEQGREARLEIWKDVPPVWHIFWWAMPEAKSAIKSAAKFIAGHLEETATDASLPSLESETAS